MHPSRGPWRNAYQFQDSQDYHTGRGNYWENSHSHEEPRGSMTVGDGRSTYTRGYHHGRPQHAYPHRQDGYDRRQDGRYAHEARSDPPRRRGSPVYEDYTGREDAPASASQFSGGHGRDQRGAQSYSRYRSSSPARKSTSPPPDSRPLFQPSMHISSPLGSPRRPRTPPPRRTEPTEDYITTSLHPSTEISDPSSSRKLLVLDLNGSLLVRGALKRPTIPRYSRSQADAHADPTKVRGMRAVHPRPYLSSFISYIFHPETKKWLDTMVWSSAQPHSVNDMVEKCFKERRNELKAIWARDTLGLTGDEYHNKTQTVKDLEKPWAELSALPPPSPTGPARADTTTSPSDSASSAKQDPSNEPSEPTRTETQRHSAKSTLLVDDSPLKAMLQPWNHLCIKEYVQEMRNKDLEVAEWEWKHKQKQKLIGKLREEHMLNKELETAKREEARKQEVSEKNIKEAAATTAMKATSASSAVGEEASAPQEPMEDGEVQEGPAEGPEGEEQHLNSKERHKLKRLAKKLQAKEAKEQAKLAAMATASGDASGATAVNGLKGLSTSGDNPPREYDPTLLAVIGILDHLKHEDNVAGWIRAGGLLSVADVPPPNATAETATSGEGTPVASATEVEHAMSATGTGGELVEEAQVEAHAELVRDGRTPPVMEEQGREKRRRVSLDENVEEVSASVFASASLSVSEAKAGEGAREKAIEMKMQAEEKTDASSSSASAQAAAQELEQAATGVPTSDSSPPTSKGSQATLSPEAQAVAASLWYDHPTVFRYWAQRGREALQKLGIEVDSGIQRP